MKRKREVDPNRNYPIQIHYIEEDDSENYFLAYNPDFGGSACSATGDTIPEAIANLTKVRCEVMAYLVSTKKPIPEPSPNPLDASTPKAQKRKYPDGCTQKCVRKLNMIGHLIKCGQDYGAREPGAHCPHPQKREVKGGIDPVVKHYLRAILREYEAIKNQESIRPNGYTWALRQALTRMYRATHPSAYDPVALKRETAKTGAVLLRMLTDAIHTDIQEQHGGKKRTPKVDFAQLAKQYVKPDQWSTMVPAHVLVHLNSETCRSFKGSVNIGYDKTIGWFILGALNKVPSLLWNEY